MPKVTKLPSGKLIFQTFDYQTNELSCETHVYPAPQGNAIGIRITFANGVKVSEMYFGNTVKSRQDYEEQRHSYPDMPPADPSAKDDNVDEAEKVERKKQQLVAAATRLGDRQTRKGWCSCDPYHGERTPRECDWVGFSRQSIRSERWTRRPVAAYRENTGHLVVELPTQPAVRSKLLKEIDRLARKGGYRGEADAGQRLAYVKLD